MSSASRRLAVHFGAGNIGRGFIGALLQDAGYHVVFADVDEELISAMRLAGGYTLTELGDKPKSKLYEDFSVLHSIIDFDELVATIAESELVTASVGANVLSRIAPIIESGLAARVRKEKLVVMACENAIGASDIIKAAMSDLTLADSKAVFANTAVDRIVPLQREHSAPDVAVEPFSEWIIDSSKLSGIELNLPGATFVPELEPFIERKLYTVNTAHLAVAFFGQLAGNDTVIEAINNPAVMQKTLRVLEETSRALVHKHNLDAAAHEVYVKKTMARLSNPAIDDELVRIGRDPLRKLSRFERLIGPAAYFAQHLGNPIALLELIAAALSFESDSDPETIRLRLKLGRLSPSEFATQVCGISSNDALFAGLVEVVHLHKSSDAYVKRLD
jgi:mannitol-1-phosphate 5-dehydrogenase